MQKQKGITAIEIIMIIMVLVIVGVVALPQLTTMQRKTVLVQNSLEMVKNSYAMAIADLLVFPSAEELAQYVDASNVLVKDDGTGLQFQLDTARLEVTTYIDTDCTEPTSTAYEPVACVDDIRLVN